MIRTILFICLLGFSSLWAQSNNKASLKLGLGMMGITYVGDLTNSETFLYRIYPGGNLSMQFVGKSALRFQMNAGFGHFSEQDDFATISDDPLLPQPNSFVNTSFFITDLRLKLVFFRRKGFQPYISTGAGIMIFTPKDAFGNFLGEDLFSRLEGENYNTTIPQLPASAGFQFRVNEVVSLGADYTFRFTPTDYLDNIGKLGNRAGNDQVHAIQVNLFFSLPGPERRATKPVPEGGIVGPEIAGKIRVPQTQTPPLFPAAPLQRVILPTVKVSSEVRNQLDKVHLQMLSYLDPPVQGGVIAPPEVQGMDPGTELTKPGIQSPNVGQQETNWLALEEKAVLERTFFYYQVREGDDMVSISKQFKTRPSTIRKLNFMVNDEVFPEIFLRLPDVGIRP